MQSKQVLATLAGSTILEGHSPPALYRCFFKDGTLLARRSSSFELSGTDSVKRRYGLPSQRRKVQGL
jgi:hypothetical protein